MIKTVADPVCGVQIEPPNAAAETTYQGNTYYFCSQECKQKFDADPQKYMKRMQDERRQ